MKKTWCYFLFCFILVNNTEAQSIAPFDFERDIVKAEQLNASAKLTVFDSAPTANYDLTYVRCEWQLSPDTLFIAGSITSYFNLIENTNELFFDASTALIIDSVKFHYEPVLFFHNNNALQIIFPSEIGAGQSDSLTVFYHGVPDASGFGSFQITPHETANTIWTLSEPYGASDWWPCKQTLTDKIDSVDVFVTTPSMYKSGGPGTLISAISAGDFTTYHWKTKYPIATYLIGVSVSNFEEFAFYAPMGDDSLLFYNLIYPESLDDAIIGINSIVPSFELFSDIYSDYPYPDEKYGHMQFGWGGGMEHQTMSSVTNFHYELLVHEMAHQWFGDKITCSSWRDIWLNEGFATYSTWMSFDFSEDPFQYYEAYLNLSRNTITSKPGGSVWVDDTTTTTRIFDGRLTYYKGAWLLHMLRWQLGESAFFDAIKSYATDPDLVYGFATTDDFKAHLESAADTSLTEFFNEWFYGQGFPSYNVLWSQDSEYNLTLSIHQTTSDPSVDLFRMQVPFRLYGDNDSLDIVLNNNSSDQIYHLQIPFSVDSIVLDPDIKLLHANDAVIKAEMLVGVLPLVVYPNPAADVLYLQLFPFGATQYTLIIYNNASQIVLRKDINLNETNALIQVDVADFSPGAYVISMRDAEHDVIKKIIIK